MPPRSSGTCPLPADLSIPVLHLSTDAEANLKLLVAVRLSPAVRLTQAAAANICLSLMYSAVAIDYTALKAPGRDKGRIQHTRYFIIPHPPYLN
ncbi:hypothetical protein J6590_021573 [Homalodisca vitripennis]|nr:hypothetical protein J6590_021573 [Homalodisca vitripennis]